MKTIIRLDWLYQTIMIAIIFATLIVDPGQAVVLAQAGLLLWQIISAIVLLILSHGRGPRRWIFLAGFFAWWRSGFLSVIGPGWLKSTMEVVDVVAPVALMICYWLLTTCNLYPTTVKYHKGKFLPHTSF